MALVPVAVVSVINNLAEGVESATKTFTLATDRINLELLQSFGDVDQDKATTGAANYQALRATLYGREAQPE